MKQINHLFFQKDKHVPKKTHHGTKSNTHGGSAICKPIILVADTNLPTYQPNFYLTTTSTTSSSGSCFRNLVILGDSPVVKGQTGFLVFNNQNPPTPPAPDYSVDNILITNVDFVSCNYGIVISGNANFWEITYNNFDTQEDPNHTFPTGAAIITTGTPDLNYPAQFTGNTITNNYFSVSNSLYTYVLYFGVSDEINVVSNVISTNYFICTDCTADPANQVTAIFFNHQYTWLNEISNNYFTGFNHGVVTCESTMNDITWNEFYNNSCAVDIRSSSGNFLNNNVTESSVVGLLINIPTIINQPVLVDENYFYNNTLDIDNTNPATVFGINFYTNCNGDC